jgi:hypothetical protein
VVIGNKSGRQVILCDLLDVIPRLVNDVPLALHKGYREKGHMLVECRLDLPFGDNNAFGLYRRGDPGAA